VKEHDGRKPFFLYVPFNAVHTPLQAPDSYLEPYQNLPEQRRKLAGMLAAMDEAVGQIVAAVEARGLRDNTLFVFSSDNGGASPGKVTDNTPLRGGKTGLYEGTKPVKAEGRYFPEMIIERSLRFMEENAQRPFFLYVGFNVPHYPEQSLKEHQALYEHLPEPRRSYAAVVTTTDHYIGRVFDKLDALGLRQNTIVLFQSDNGHSTENFQVRVDGHTSGLPKGHDYGAHGGGGNTGRWTGYKGTFLEGGIRTPAVLRYPARVPRGAVRDQAVMVFDWFPTVLELCGVPLPDATLDGRSLLPVIRSADANPPHAVLHFQWQDQWAVREGDWKLIGRPANRNQPELGASLQLLRLADTEPERKNHLQEQPQVAARLQALHEEWARQVAPPKRGGGR